MNMRAVFFLATWGTLACLHPPPTSAHAFSEEVLFGDTSLGGTPLGDTPLRDMPLRDTPLRDISLEEAPPHALRQRAALWQALLTELDLRLEAGQLKAEELGWLKTRLEHAWKARGKERLPKALHARAQAFLEKLQMHLVSPPDTLEAFIWPLWPAELSSPFGYRIHPLTGRRRFHQGVDLKATAREEVNSIQSGWVLYAGWAGGYGYMVEVLHPGGSFSRYAHLSKVKVKVGEKVLMGTVVGLAGDSGQATGVHLHFELWKGGRPVDPTLHLP